MVSDQCPFFWTYDDARILGNTRFHSLRAISDFLLLWVHKEILTVPFVGNISQPVVVDTRLQMSLFDTKVDIFGNDTMTIVDVSVEKNGGKK